MCEDQRPIYLFLSYPSTIYLFQGPNWGSQDSGLPIYEFSFFKTLTFLAVLELVLVEQTGLELQDLPIFLTQVLGLKACVSTAWLSCMC